MVIELKSEFCDIKGKRVHLIGIGGSSMSGLALMLKYFGCIVSGSDMNEGHTVQNLRRAGISVVVGHNRDNVKGVDIAVYSLAISPDNPEIEECKNLGIRLIERSVLLGQLSREYNTLVAVCGTHGKTTVTSMISQILLEAGKDPTVHIGGVYDAIGGNIRLGSRDLFVTEACEYRRSFMNLKPDAIIINNIDKDHLDCYRDIDDITHSFLCFLSKLSEDGWILGNGDDPRVIKVMERSGRRHSTFGTSKLCDYRLEAVSEDEKGYISFDVQKGEEKLGHVSMAVPGLFNALNALSAVAAAHMLGVNAQEACNIIGRFTGAKRRFEMTGTLNGAELFTDYGHNPTEIRNAVSIARKRCRQGRLWAVIQPHTYSRIKTLFNDYMTCTKEADITLVTDIYAARETDPADIDSKMLVDGMNDTGVKAVLTRTFEDAANEIISGIRPGDLMITLGCGNINLLNDMLLEKKESKIK